MFRIRHPSRQRAGSIASPTSRRGGRGQGVVEFALLAPVLLLILLFAIDFGRALYGWVVLQNSSRIAANFASYNPEGWRDNDAAIKASYQGQIDDDLQAVAYCPLSMAPDPVFSDGPDTAVAGGPPDTTYDVGDTVKVSLTCDFAPLTPIITFITGSTVELGASSEFRIRAGDIAGLPHATRIPPITSASPGPSGSGSPSSPPSAPPSAPPSSPACLIVPNLADFNGGSETVGQARAEWTAAGFTGSFSPSGQNNRIVLGQSIVPGACVAASSAITVTHS